jgi:uncharacterized OsmC-like protein
MKATIDWTGDASFRATSGSGHSVQMDGPPDHGGKDLGPRPMEMMLMGLGGCSSFDVMSILQKSRQDVTACHAELEAERADTVPAVFTRHPSAFRGHRKQPQGKPGEAGRQPLGREVLLCVYHAGKGGRYHHPQP